jgi:copper chaperone CopZ
MAAVDAAKAIKGIFFVDDDMMNATLTIGYDDSKTDPERIKQEMKAGGFPIEGEPEAVK